jgi:MFS family permease
VGGEPGPLRARDEEPVGESIAGLPAGPGAAGGTSALRHRWFRFYAALTLLSGIGTLAEDVPRRWLAKALTDKLFVVGALGFASNFGDLLSGLVFSVRRESRNLRRSLAVVQFLLAVVAATLAALAATSTLSPWHLLVASFLVGALYAPARAMGAALAVRAVPRESAASATAVLAAMGSIARLAGPAVGGLLLEAGSAATVFAFNAASFIPLALLLLLSRGTLGPAGARPAPVSPPLPAPPGAFRRALLALLAPGLFGIPYITVFPAIAAGAGGPQALGWLYSALGLGSLVGASGAIARARHATGAPGPLFAALALLQALGILAVSTFARVPLPLTLAAVAAVAAVNAFYLARLGAVVGWIARDGDGSRTFARFYMMLLGCMALAEPAVGALADRAGTQMCLRVLAAAAALVSAGLWWALRRAPAASPAAPA